jgi:hypothetical protein
VVVELLLVCLRRWYVLLVGVLCVAAVAFTLDRTPGVYFAQVDVLFLADDSSAGGNPLQNQEDSVIHFASVVQQSVSDGAVQLRLSSPSATLQGSGIREGYVARLSDAGGQWESSFNRAVIEIEVVDSSPAEVNRVLDEVLGRIESETERIQSDAGIDPAAWVTADSETDDVSIGYMGSTRGSRLRGLAAVALVGGAATLVTAALFDRWRSRRAAVRSRGAVEPAAV